MQARAHMRTSLDAARLFFDCAGLLCFLLRQLAVGGIAIHRMLLAIPLFLVLWGSSAPLVQFRLPTAPLASPDRSELEPRTVDPRCPAPFPCPCPLGALDLHVSAGCA